MPRLAAAEVLTQPTAGPASASQPGYQPYAPLQQRHAAPAPVFKKPTLTHVSSACEACRKSKRRCDAKAPCTNCVRRHLVCDIQPEKDGRRQKKDRLAYLQRKASTLDTILNAIRTVEPAKARLLMNFVRNTESHPEIMAFAESLLADHQATAEAAVQPAAFEHAPRRPSPLAFSSSAPPSAMQPLLPGSPPAPPPPPSAPPALEHTGARYDAKRRGLSIQSLLN